VSLTTAKGKPDARRKIKRANNVAGPRCIRRQVTIDRRRRRLRRSPLIDRARELKFRKEPLRHGSDEFTSVRANIQLAPSIRATVPLTRERERERERE